jgi:predicted nuclease of predicted toxin-antitoxin system
MHFLVDECTGPTVARWLRDQGHDVFSVYEQARGSQDQDVLQRALDENRILITNNKDFGEKIFRELQPHSGVILLRLADERSVNKIDALQRVLAIYSDRLVNNFVVVTDTRVRISSQT